MLADRTRILQVSKDIGQLNFNPQKAHEHSSAAIDNEEIKDPTMDFYQRGMKFEQENLKLKAELEAKRDLLFVQLHRLERSLKETLSDTECLSPNDISFSQAIATFLESWSELTTLDAQISTVVTKVYNACIGKPTYNINRGIIIALKNYYLALEQHNESVEREYAEYSTSLKKVNFLSKSNTASGYDSTRGNFFARQMMAETLNKWYDSATTIQAEAILFTVGGASAISAISEYLSCSTIVTPNLYYSLWDSKKKKDNLNLFTFELKEENGFQINAEALQTALDAALDQEKRTGIPVRAVLITDPNNPTGRVVSEEESEKIISLLSRPKYKNIYLVVDEAYAEMRFDRAYNKSLVSKVLAQDNEELKQRLIFFRSATKGLSAAGERMACVVSLNAEVLQKLENNRVLQVGHPPVSTQIGYAHGMKYLVEHLEDQENLIEHYKQQVSYVHDELKSLGAHVKSDKYNIEGSFYVIADLSELIGYQPPNDKDFLKTDKDIAEFLLNEKGIMFCPLSNLGADPTKGYFRVTCSIGFEDLQEMMKLLKSCLVTARRHKSAFHSLGDFPSASNLIDKPTLPGSTLAIYTSISLGAKGSKNSLSTVSDASSTVSSGADNDSPHHSAASDDPHLKRRSRSCPNTRQRKRARTGLQRESYVFGTQGEKSMVRRDGYPSLSAANA